VLMAFGAWRSSLPWFPIATRAHREVALLVEMLADDYARRVVDDRTLATAIALVSSETPRAASAASAMESHDSWAPVGSSREQLAARVGRLVDGRSALALPGRVLVIAASVALILVPTVLLLLPTAFAAA
jgi:hypothetical protein